MKSFFTYIVVGQLIIITLGCSRPDTIMLQGIWNFQLDTGNVGIMERWYEKTLGDKIMLPGSMAENGKGFNPTIETEWTGSIYDSSWFYNPDMEKYRNIENPKFPFWLTPDKYYVGYAWYQKAIKIPSHWENQSLSLFLERPHWQTRLWFDTLSLGGQNSLSTPHKYIIPAEYVNPGKHRITILIDNAIRGIDPGINSHSITDHTQGNWNGIAGKLYISKVGSTRIKQVRLQPDISKGSLKTMISITKKLKTAWLTIEVEGLNHTHRVPSAKYEIADTTDEILIDLPMGKDFKSWSEFSPDLYQMVITLENEHGLLDTRKEIFGMREFKVNDNRFRINGIPIFLRGTTECCVFPLTGYQPVNEEEWARVFSICKSHGLNHMRFHSYCPPEAAFTAADKAGIYLQVEGPSWAKYSVTLGNGKPIDNYLMDETKRIIDTYGNHPSFCMMAYGNEPSGNYVPYLKNWVDHFRKYDPQRVFTGASTGRSWAIIENSDYIVRSAPRGLKWRDKQPESNFNYRDKTENQKRPYITFEMGQWCAFPNFEEIDKYTGYLKARNFELFRNELSKNHIGDQARDFLMASGKLQALCYKQEIEATLRTPNLAGFQLLSLNDFSGQGTALVGVLDAFWDEKGYITASEFSTFCNQVVPLLRIPKYTYLNTEAFLGKIEVANFSGAELSNKTLTWQVTNQDSIIRKSGSFKFESIPIGNCIDAGIIRFSFEFADKAEKLNLKVQIGEYVNQWSIWVYPDTKLRVDTTGIYICKKPDNKAHHVLKDGGNVLILASGNIENGKDIVQHFTPVFWNTSWFRMRPPHTTGILIKDTHALFNDFPTDAYSDLQWWEIANRQQVMNLENFPPEFRPVVQPIDTWFLNRRLAMLFEARVDNGKLIVCSIDLTKNLEKRIVAKQLYSSIISYMQSDHFNPVHELDFKIINELFEVKEREVWNPYVKENP